MATSLSDLAEHPVVGKVLSDLQEFDESAATKLRSLGQFLVDSENKLIALMKNEEPPADAPGSIEFGLMLYWIHEYLPDIAKYFPPTQITKETIALWMKKLGAGGVLDEEGDLVAFTEYAVLDEGWLIVAPYYLATLLFPETNAKFGTDPCILKIPDDDPVTIALVGDWGTGKWADGTTDGPALAIKQQIEGLDPRPDYTIHLGDVYYVGSHYPDIEKEKFLDLWPVGSKGTFTLNSNHEMYAGGRGYFDVALKVNGPFGHQNQTSYFAIEYGNWLILGLDSAFASTDFLYMNGALNEEQKSFVKKVNADFQPAGNKNIIVMTHHTGTNLAGTQIMGKKPNCLWDDVRDALGGEGPDYWYWGHAHNGVVYNASTALGSKTKARCIGHGAIPFGDSNLLKQSAAVEWYANTPYPNPDAEQKNRVLNGFALLTLSPAPLKEEFYEQGNPNPVWPSAS